MLANLPWYLDLDRRAWEYWGGVPVLTLDLETTNLEHGDPRNPDNRIVKIAVKVDGGAVVTDPYRSFDAIEALEGKPAILVAQNAKFELGWLNREGFDTSQWLPFDTMIAEYVLAGNRRVRLDLDSISKRYGHGGKGRLIDRLMKAGVCPSEMPRRMLRERVAWDVDRTYKIHRAQTEKMRREGLLPVFFTRCILTPVLAHMETYGMSLDPERVAAEYDAAIQKRRELGLELATIAAGSKLRGPQLAKLIYETLGFQELTNYRGEVQKTATGRPKTDTDTILALKAATPEQKRFQTLMRDYNKVEAAITKALEFFQRVVVERGGSFVATFNQTVTQTHRLSSSGKRIRFKDGKERGAQFQNLPQVFKKLFRARDGYALMEADGMGLEFRVAGSLARDEQVREDVETGADIHRYTASKIYHIEEAEVSPAQRRAAKEFTFKPLYGGNSGTRRQKEYFAAFREKYEAVYKMQMGWVHTVLKDGRLKTASGLVFYWPDTKMTESGYITNTPSIFNYPVQSLATADIIPVSVVYTFWGLRAAGVDARLLNTIHDSVILEVKKESLDKAGEIVVESFLDKTYEYLEAVYGLSLSVPLGVEYKAGTHWGSGESVQVSYAKGGEKHESASRGNGLPRLRKAVSGPKDQAEHHSAHG